MDNFVYVSCNFINIGPFSSNPLSFGILNVRLHIVKNNVVFVSNTLYFCLNLHNRCLLIWKHCSNYFVTTYVLHVQLHDFDVGYWYSVYYSNLSVGPYSYFLLLINCLKCYRCTITPFLIIIHKLPIQCLLQSARHNIDCGYVHSF